MTEYGTRRYDDDEGLGAQIADAKFGSDLCLFLQNPDGVMTTDRELDDRRSMATLKEWDVDVIALPETNRNWQREWIQNKWRGGSSEYGHVLRYTALALINLRKNMRVTSRAE